MNDAMHATHANNDALAAEVQRLRAALDAANARADAAERATDDLHVMLSCLPEYMRYCNDTEGPALPLAEWWAAQPGADESEAQP